MFEVMVETLRAFFKLRAAGKKMGAVTSWGGGSWGLMRSLALEGPQTVPDLARARPVARQRIQKIADELASAGLVEFMENPAHLRSKLVRLTERGDVKYREVTEKILDASDAMARDMAEPDLRTAAAVLRSLNGKLSR